MLRTAFAALLIAPIALGCHSSSGTTSAKAGPSANDAKKDLILGMWVCLANNVDAKPEETLEFRSDGTATIKQRTREAIVLKYQREPRATWDSRHGLSAKGSPKSSLMPPNGPRAEVITFADPKSGQFMDGGGISLFFDPDSNTLSFPLSQLWCRPGDENRVRDLMGITAREQQQEQRENDLKRWRPKQDISARWHRAWTVPLSFEEHWRYSMTTVGSIDGSGLIIASDAKGFTVLNEHGRFIGNVTTTEVGDRYLAVGMSRGSPIVVQFGTWSSAMDAYDLHGKHLWKFDTGQRGIDYVAAVAIDGKNSGFAIAYNGGDGIELVSGEGKSVWRAPLDSNAWSISAARFQRIDPDSILSIGPSGAIALDIKGRKFRDFDAGEYGSVGSADLNGDGIDEVLTLGTTVSSGELLTVFSHDGRELWAKKGAEVDVAYVEGNPFVFGIFAKSRLLGVATAISIRFFEPRGKIFGEFLTPNGIEAVAVLHRRKEPDALLIRSKVGVECYEFR